MIELNGKDLVDHLDLGYGLTVTSTRPDAPVGSIVTLEFTGATHSTTITFFRDGAISDSNSNTNPSGTHLKLTFDANRKSGTGVQIADPGFEATWNN